MVFFKILFFSFIAYSQTSLPELVTKQAIQNIRLTTRDGRYTYYQRGSESLLLSHNYSVTEILKLPQGTQFDVISTSARRNILIIAHEKYHQTHSILQPHKVYWSQFGSKNVNELTNGNSAKLHQDDQWASVFSAVDKKLSFFKLNNNAQNFTIKLNNRINPFYTPEVAMVNEDIVIYTDINKDGLMGLLSYNRRTKKNKLIYKVDEPYFYIDFCLSKNKLVVGQFSYDRGQKFSQILVADTNKFDFNELYLSKSDDLGNLNCPSTESKVYFIKDTTGDKSRITSDVFSIDLNSKKLNQETNKDHITQLVDMDGMLLVPSKGKYFVLKGNSQLNTMDQLRQQ